MTAPLRLRPVFKERPWGGRRLAERFGYDLPEGRIGECWGISAHPNGPSTVVSGEHAGRTLPEVWEADPAFFGHPDDEEFPLLVKLLDAREWLSVQVHPDDAQAARLEGEPRGKTECWYVVAAEPGAQLVIGHRAADREQLAACIDAGAWDDLLLRREVAAGDFVHVPSGTIHALGPGVLVCEVQQSSDTTYRVYDWDRVDAQGRRRELHLDKAKEVATVPYDPAVTDTAADPEVVAGGRRRLLVDGEHFAVTLHEVRGEGYRVPVDRYELWTVVAGSGTAALDGSSHPLRAGDHLILPAGAGDVSLAGEVTIVAAVAA
ncbi:MAG TPA: type I phosphomannose isomerase catalytic subunit [Egibacteraceae bacterium]